MSKRTRKMEDADVKKKSGTSDIQEDIKDLLSQLSTKVDDGFKRTDKRLDEFDTRMNGYEDRLKAMSDQSAKDREDIKALMEWATRPERRPAPAAPTQAPASFAPAATASAHVSAAAVRPQAQPVYYPVYAPGATDASASVRVSYDRNDINIDIFLKR